MNLYGYDGSDNQLFKRVKNGEKWYFEPKNKPGKALDHDTLNKKLIILSYHGGINQLWDLEGLEVSSEHMNLPRFYTQEEYDRFKTELNQFTGQQTSPDDWRYHYYLGAKLDVNFVGTHKDGMHWIDNNNEVDGEYKLVNTFESWNAGEPNNYAGVESCVAVDWSKGGWNDSPCGQGNYNVVCEERRH